MFVIRSIAQAQTNRRDDLVKAMRQMATELKEFVGENPRFLTGSIGLSDSTVIMETETKSLADFETGLAKANSSPMMAKYGAQFAELAIPGSHRFEIYRLYK